jgi:hypothetical protein
LDFVKPRLICFWILSARAEFDFLARAAIKKEI